MKIGFGDCHPAVNLIFFAGIAVFGMLFRHPATVAVCFFCALIYYIRLCGKRAVKSFFCFIVPMLVFVVIMNGLFSHYGNTVLFTLPSGSSVTLESVTYGFILGAAAVSIIMWFFCYNEIVTEDKFLYVFGKILPAGALVISMALRFIPLYRNRLRIISEAQSGIGTGYKNGGFIQKIRNGGRIISILITWSLENSVEVSDSMRAKGYGLKGRKSYSCYRWKHRDVLLICLMLLLYGIMTVGYINNSLNCVYTPQIKICPLSGFGAVTAAAFALLCLMPLITDLKEDIKWNRLKSKM